MGFKIGICGTGGFARNFVPLFKAHPLVTEVVLADLIRERAAEQAAKHGISRVLSSLDALCASDVDAIAIMTQRQLHGPQALQALKAGKHVYSAVPIGQTVDEIRDIVQAVEETRLIYMMGETSYYYPATIYCRQRFRSGDFGEFVYGEGQYYHDMSHFYEPFRRSGGPNWRRVAGIPPMHYPTHSVSMILSVTGARATTVSCLGFEDRHPDGIFRVGANQWDNLFSNETALMRTSDGGMIRINEFRRIGWRGMSSVQMSLYGTDGCYEEQANSQAWVTIDPKEMVDLSDVLRCHTKFPPEVRVMVNWQ
jgi:predicted dehydrogenase